MSKTFTHDQVSRHTSPSDCWVVLYGNVWDVTEFLPSHPGGSKIILQLAGTDATDEYDPIHPPGTLEQSLPPEAKLGRFDAATVPAVQESSSADAPREDTPLEELLNLHDIEAEATRKINAKTWGYYYSAADDLKSKALNNAVYGQILLRPRIFVDCTRCDTSTTLLGHRVKVPFYAAPAAMARMAHPAGEHGIAKACAAYGAMQIISNNASQTPEQIVAGAAPDQVFGWQMYVQTDRRRTEATLARIHALPAVKFVCLTLDAPVPGKREHDERANSVGARLAVRSSVRDGAAGSAGVEGKRTDRAAGVGASLFLGTAADLTWETTLRWLAGRTRLPIVLKGVQTHEDAYLASQHAPLVRGIILSNHGGRAADTAPPAVHTLLEIRKYCPSVLERVEVWVDGGIKRGTDVVKALALGARAVGMGRAPLFGLGAGGQAGVERVLEIVEGEVRTAMRLLGVERVEQLGPRHVNSRAVERDVWDGAGGMDEGESVSKAVSKWVEAKL